MIENHQPIEKQVSHENGAVDVHSIFHTIQGEGPFAGWPATFIRLAGCNLQCPGCDTDYTRNRQLMELHEVLDILDRWKVGLGHLVVITGGEPFRQNIGRLVECLLEADFRVQIETNGTLYQELPWSHESLTIVCSPKAGAINAQLEPHIDAYKYVLDADHVSSKDGLPGKTLLRDNHVARPVDDGTDGRIYVSPLDEGSIYKNKKNTETAIATCMKYGYILCLQIHKVIGLP